MSATSKEDQRCPNPTPIFIYGTLCATPLLAWALTGDCRNVDLVTPLLRPAKVSGFARYGVRGRDFPAAVECPGSHISGYLVTCDTVSQRRKLDDFEGEVYKATPVRVQILGQDGDTTMEFIEADMYLWNGSHDDLTLQLWDLDAFTKERLEDWLDLFDGMELIG
jgi:gamma-glutamylcyclotransferase (GGCT)/AIG2-like uncharacterized protein YtfP